MRGEQNISFTHFGMNVSSQENFGSCTLWPCTCSGRWTLQHRNVSTLGLFGAGNFRHKEVLAPWTFWQQKISAFGYFGTLQSNMDILAQTFRHLCYCAEMSMCRNVPMPKCSCAKKSSCRKVLVPKSPHVEMFRR